MKKTTKWGYQAYTKPDETKKTIHTRVAEKKYGMEKLPPGFEVHHIDGDKNNNQYYNLILLHKKDHRRVHLKKSLIIKSVRSSEGKNCD